jgi:hypothetical protein
MRDVSVAIEPGGLARAGATDICAMAISVGGGPKTIGGNALPEPAFSVGCDGVILGVIIGVIIGGGGGVVVNCLAGGGAVLTGIGLGAGFGATARGGSGATARLAMAGLTDNAGLGAARTGLRPRTTSSV